MIIKLDLRKLIKSLSIPLVIGLFSAFLTRSDVESFEMNAAKPFFAVPGWVFPVVWTVLYFLMGIAAYIIEITDTKISKKRAVYLNYAQLFFNFCWSIIFFTFRAYLFAFVWLIVLWVLIIATTLEYNKISKAASYLLIPYIIWVTFAGVLNFSIYLLN